MSDTNLMLIDSMARLFADIVPSSTMAWDQSDATTATWTSAWVRIVESGLPRLLVAESRQGFGGTWKDAGAVFALTGRHALPYPVAETILANGLLDEAGLPACNGPITVGRADSTARLDGKSSASATFTGTLKAVPWARSCKEVVTLLRPAAGAGNHVRAMVVKLCVADAANTIARRNIAGEPRDDLIFADAQPQLIAEVHAHTATLLQRGALARTAQMAGALEALLDLTVKYARERQQFGRALAAFQAIQQQIAVLAAETAAVGCAASAACEAAEKWASNSVDTSFEISAAKLRANEAAGISNGIAHQVHGAMGITREYRLHLLTRRLWSWRGEFGNDSYLKNTLSRRILERGADNFWIDLTARDTAAPMTETA